MPRNATGLLVLIPIFVSLATVAITDNGEETSTFDADLTLDDMKKIHKQGIENQFCAYFIDIGQGDSIFLKGDQLVLIDGGDYVKSNAEKIKSVLERNGKGLGDLDTIILTHPDQDHYGGLLLLLREDQKEKDEDGIYPFLLKETERYDGNQIRDEGKRLKEFKERWSVTDYSYDNEVLWRDKKVIEISDGVLMNTLFPVKDNHIEKQDVIKLTEIYSNYVEELEEAQDKGLKNTGNSESIHNSNSLVFKITYDEFSLLLTGDAEATTEYMLWNDYGNDLKSDVVKISHHGGAYSSIPQFVKATSPLVAVASADWERTKNTHHHPSEWALDSYKNQGSKVYRTDLDGTVEICSDGKSFLVETDGSRYTHGESDSHMFVILGEQPQKIAYVIDSDEFDPLMQISQISYDEQNKTLLVEFSESDFEGTVTYTIPKTLFDDVQVIGDEGVVDYDVSESDDELEITVTHESGNDTTIIKGI